MYILKFKNAGNRESEAGLFKTDLQAHNWIGNNPHVQHPELRKATDEELKRWSGYDAMFSKTAEAKRG